MGDHVCRTCGAEIPPSAPMQQRYCHNPCKPPSHRPRTKPSPPPPSDGITRLSVAPRDAWVLMKRLAQFHGAHKPEGVRQETWIAIRGGRLESISADELCALASAYPGTLYVLGLTTDEYS